MRDLRSRSPISWAAFAAGLASCVLQAHGRAQDRVELTPNQAVSLAEGDVIVIGQRRYTVALGEALPGGAHGG